MDFCKYTSAAMEMAIADFFCYENILNLEVELHCFKRMLEVADVVGSGFDPRSGKIGGNVFVDFSLFVLFNLTICSICR